MREECGVAPHVHIFVAQRLYAEVRVIEDDDVLRAEGQSRLVEQRGVDGEEHARAARAQLFSAAARRRVGGVVLLL